jgi:hypothetical protein
MENDNHNNPEFPKAFTKCPVCGCEETICNKVKAEEVANNRMKPETRVGFQSAVPIVDPTRLVAQLTAPVIVALFDICADCGAYYCREANLTKGMVATQPQKPMPGQMPFMGRG